MNYDITVVGTNKKIALFATPWFEWAFELRIENYFSRTIDVSAESIPIYYFGLISEA